MLEISQNSKENTCARVSSYLNQNQHLEKKISEQPIICKLGDISEARSIVVQTCIVPGNTRTRFIKQSSPAFTEPEMQIESQLLEAAGIQDLIKNWCMGLVDDNTGNCRFDHIHWKNP